jgi:glycosyltransferase involved in cell wall biosynthesis
VAPPSSVSVILCTRNRSIPLRETLRTLDALELPAMTDLEIIVVDNGSTDDTPGVVHDFAARSPRSVRYVHEPQPGLSAARNRGVAAARGALLLFTDDDCLPAADWVVAALRALEGNPCQIIGGRVELHDPSAAPVTIKTSQAAETLDSPDDLYGFLHGCNMAIGRAVIEAIGSFDTRFGAGGPLISAEDTDLVYRAFKAGIPVRYDPDLVVFHDHGRHSSEQVDKLMKGYRLGMGGFGMKHLLKGDVVPIRLCYWDLYSALQDYAHKRVGIPHLLTEGHIILGAFKFAVGAALGWSRPISGKLRPVDRATRYPDQLRSAATK